MGDISAPSTPPWPGARGFREEVNEQGGLKSAEEGHSWRVRVSGERVSGGQCWGESVGSAQLTSSYFAVLSKCPREGVQVPPFSQLGKA